MRLLNVGDNLSRRSCHHAGKQAYSYAWMIRAHRFNRKPQGNGVRDENLLNVEIRAEVQHNLVSLRVGFGVSTVNLWIIADNLT